MELQPVVILSAERTGRVDNAERTARLAAALQALRLPFKAVNGVYRGVGENSFVVVVDSERALGSVVGLAAAFEQESVLVVDSARRASLLYLGGGEPVPLGTFRAVPPAQAASRDAYTYDPATDQYWVAGS